MGAQATMGDNAEFEKLSTLEARLAAALDRIAVGVGEALTQLPPEDPAYTSGALEDAQIRAEAAEARVAELEAWIEAQGTPRATGDHAALEAERDAALARAAALDADAHDWSRAVAQRDETIADLRAALAEAQGDAGSGAAPDPEQSGEIARLTARIADLEGKLARMRAERAEAIAERDEARDIAEELQVAGGMDPDDRAMALRAEVKELRTITERLTKNINRLRGDKAGDPGVLNKSLVVELDALRAARASEAAEIERILADLSRADAGEGEHA